MFQFDANKVAACRVTCGARLGLAEWVLGDDVEALASGHPKQRALVVLDLAVGHLAAGRIEAAFALASRALDTGLQYRSAEHAPASRQPVQTTELQLPWMTSTRTLSNRTASPCGIRTRRHHGID
ncbi:hypothetical protein [Streptomyces bluensis]|uniref:hypothetical protein n=1 Tax=Streptomyces bluensis TaxID=33897 RepID=UPI0033216E16